MAKSLSKTGPGFGFGQKNQKRKKQMGGMMKLHPATM